MKKQKNRNIEAIYPLSPMQQGMLYHDRHGEDGTAYFIQFHHAISGGLDVPAFKRAWERLIERHAVMRTLFIWKDREIPIQLVQKRVKLPWQEHDWRDLSPSEYREKRDAFLRDDRSLGFDFSKAPLMRLAVIRRTDEVFDFIWSAHHILMDGWCMSLVTNELFAFYHAFCRGEDLRIAPPRPYRDYIQWLKKQDMGEAKAFWRRTLKGFTKPTLASKTVMGTDTTDKTEGYGQREMALSAETTSGLEELARKNRITMNTLVQGAWALVLGCFGGVEDVVFGVTASGRPESLPGSQSMIGLFVNTLPMRVRIEPNAPLLPWLRNIQELQMEMRRYEYTPLFEIQGWSEVKGGSPLFENIMLFQNVPGSASRGKTAPRETAAENRLSGQGRGVDVSNESTSPEETMRLRT